VANNESIKKTIIVTLLLCLVCSVIVSVTAILLRPIQNANKTLDFKRNVLMVSGLYQEGVNVEKTFSQQITRKVVDLESGMFTDAVDPATYDQRAAAKDPARSIKLTDAQDIAKIGRREKLSVVYLVIENSEIKTIVLPIKGYGLWSTLYGFIALKADANTVDGIIFYEHKETPGLGGEVDNPKWRAQWVNKQIYGQGDTVALRVIKGHVEESSPSAVHQIDGLAGATLTSKGVNDLVHFWLGENGYQNFLNHLKSGAISL
jgi:Na+-transporting NADH:ubiquinone oxidoreductase subunit C